MKKYLPLWPCILGFAAARITLIVINYGSYNSTDEGIFTDGSMVVALFAMGLIFLFIFVKKPLLHESFVDRIAIACMLGEAVVAGVYAIVNLHGDCSLAELLLLSALTALFATGSLCYWLRRARGSSSTTAAVFVFLALCLSEVVIYVCSLLPHYVCDIIVVGFALLQIPCIFWARKQTQPYELNGELVESGYFGFTKTLISDRRFLLATGAGIALLSLVLGLLRGYPDGLPIDFTPWTHLVCFVLTVALCVLILLYALHGKHRIMTIGVWLMMQGLACLALLAYAAFPDNLAVGAIFTTALNTIMSGFVWYVIIAFMSNGWRDPYFYATLGFMVWLGFRAVARLVLLNLYAVYANTLFMNASMAIMLMISTQVTFMLFIKIYRKEEQGEEEEEPEKSKPIKKLLGMDINASQSSARLASMHHNAEELGRQYLLSDREVEVLSLYALGFTQKRVAEELFISPATVHAHIKRIYTKTGMHSRQEILDYMQSYTS